jgi:membrane-associated phospholipid phosphatase
MSPSTTRPLSTNGSSGKDSRSVLSAAGFASRFARSRTTSAFFERSRSYADAVRNRDPRTLTITGLLVGLVAAVSAFAHLTEDYLTGDPIVRWDVHFARWLHVHASDPLVRVFDAITLGGNAAVLFVLVAAIGIVLLRRARPSEAAVIALACGGAVLVNALLKLIFHRPRPELAFVHLDTYSFPSGHAAVSTATFTTIAFLLARRYRTVRARALIVVATALAIILVGFSRLYLGAHYLSDVLAGISFGFAWAMVCLLAYTVWGERLNAWRRQL